MIGLYFADQANRGQDVSPALGGMLNAVWYGAEIVAALSMGVLADRLAPHILMVVGGLLGAMGMGLLGFTRFVSAFFFSRTLEGAAGGANAPAILAYLTDITEEAQESRGRLMAFFELTLVGGIALVGPIGAKLWQRLGTGAFFALGAVYILSSAAFSLGASKNKARSTEEAFDGLKRNTVPWVTFTDPAVAHVGLTEEQAREQFGDAIHVHMRPMKESIVRSVKTTPKVF